MRAKGAKKRGDTRFSVSHGSANSETKNFPIKGNKEAVDWNLFASYASRKPLFAPVSFQFDVALRRIFAKKSRERSTTPWESLDPRAETVTSNR